MQRMMGIRIRRLAMSSALVGAALAMAGPASAQDYGLLVSGDGNSGVAGAFNPAGTTLQGNLIGFYANGIGIEFENFGTVRGNSPGHAGIMFDQNDSIIFNYGLVSGAGFGITTSSWYNPVTGLFEGRAINSIVLNQGTIIGDSNDGVRLIGGGEVLNLGTIEGRAGGGADGVSIFAHAGQNTSGQTFIGSVVNAGTIFGNRFGVIQSTGGVVQNGGSITGNVGGVTIQDGLNDGGKTGTVTNSGSITGGSGVSFGVHLVSSTLTNSGSITGTATAGVENLGTNPMTIDNLAGGSIVGALKGIHAAEGAVIVTNAGTIRGNGTYDGFQATPDGGISIGVAGSSITNSGSISGARFGITTYNYYNAQTGLTEPRAVGTTVTNLAGGSIIGEGDDGVRLIGGGTVTNAGLIEGRAFVRAEGVSMFALNGQDTSGQTSIGTVINLAGGSIIGNRFGIGLSGGGVIENAGLVQGADFSAGSFDPYGAGVLLQSSPIEPGKTGTLSNNGTVIGGHGVLLGGTLASTLITNSGTITGTQASGIYNASGGIATVNNGAGGGITGALKGIHAGEAGVIVNNTGTIRGNGTYDGFDATPDGGISIGVGGSSVTNSGSISGARFGITTYNYYNAQTSQLEPLAVGTVVTNLAGGSIIGEGDDGVRLIGGGTVTNAGIIEGRSFQFADGVSMFALQGQDTTGQTGMGTVRNEAGGTIFGNRFGVALSGGGVIDNAGTILASDFSTGSLDGFGGGVLFQAAAWEAGKIGSLYNSGSISGGNGVIFGAFLAGGTLENSGSITGTQAAGVHNTGLNTITIDNQAGGSISGAVYGVRLANGGTVDNAGSISGTSGAILIEGQASNPGQIAIVNNSGTLGGGTGILLGGPGGNALGGAQITNSGTILVTVAGPGIFSGFSGLTTIDNLAGASITGRNSGIIGRDGAIAVTNAGTIIGQAGGSNGGIVIEQAGSSVSNSGLIESVNFGVTANSYQGTQPLAVGTIISNSGTIRGLNNDGVRLTGGGTITNSGLIEGVTGGLTDGVSMFSHTTQDVSAITAIGTVNNLAGGSIRGARTGMILSGGGIVNNEGSIWAADTTTGLLSGLGTGIVIQDVASVPSKIGLITNSGTISGGIGISFAGSLASNSVVNSGSIIGRLGDGITSLGGAALEIDNQAGGTISGATSAIYGQYAPLVVTNAGTIMGQGGGNYGAIVIEQGNSSVSNSGLIEGANFGITANPFFNSVTGLNEARATNTVVTNSGTIRGLTNDGVRLQGGGTVTNSGLIEAVADPLNRGADGVSMFAINGQDLAGITAIGTVNNLAGGAIIGARAGIILSVGGTVNNAGSIWAPDFTPVSLDGFGTGIIIQDAAGGSNKIGTLANSGSIAGGNGVTFGGSLASGLLGNSGSIAGRVGIGVQNLSTGALAIDNLAGGNITGATWGILGRNGAITVANAGTITGTGIGQAAIQIEQAGSSVSNSGLIEGANYGITTASFVNASGVNEGRAIGTVVENSGTIRGQNNDGVRLIGGGSVSNSGLIEGLTNAGADGVSIFTHSGQNTAGFSSMGTVDNQAGGTIFGNRFGIIMSTGGVVNNLGSISGNSGGVSIQDGLNDGGKTGTVANVGSISGGSGVTFGVHLVATGLTNSGSITGTQGAGVITEAGTLTLNNSGSIRSEGTSISANIPDSSSTTANTSRADGGVVIAAANSVIDNSGSISGRVHGIVVVPQINIQTGAYEGLARNTSITNSGLIRGETDDGIRLAGGGSVMNSGTIEGLSGTNTDGITMFAFTGQDTSAMPTIGSVTNLAGGSISGARVGVLMSKGGTVTNAGSISGAGASAGSSAGGGVVFQNGTGQPAQFADLINSGVITGTDGVRFNGSLNAPASVTNSGTISGTGTTSNDAAILHYATSALVVTNTATGIITSEKFGIWAAGVLNVNNSGQIITAGSIFGSGINGVGGATNVLNFGLISGWHGIETSTAVANTFVENFGTIRGTGDSGVVLLLGGTVTNNGLIEGQQLGVVMSTDFSQPLGPQGVGVITNGMSGTINGGLYGAIYLTARGTIDNYGTINGNILTNGGTIINNGVINGDVSNSTASVYLNNIGNLNGTFQTTSGIFVNIDNSGTLGAVQSDGVNNMINMGSVGPIQFGAADDILTLKANSHLLGSVGGGDGFDRLRLDSGSAPLQQLTDFQQFEKLDVFSGQWEAQAATGSFNGIEIFGGRLVLTGSLSGAMTIRNGGTFQIGNGGSLVGFTGNIANSGSLIANIGSSYSLASVISGTGTLQKLGPGRLTLTAASTYTGATTVSGGTLAVNGSIVSPVTVQAGGALGGTGSVANVTVLGGGTLAPGNGIGTLTVNGTLAFSSGSRFAVDANAAGQADRVNVVGNATIGSNVIVNVTAANGTWNPATKYVIMNATGKITGLFAGVTSDLIFLDPKLGQTSKTVELTLKRNSLALAAAAATTSQASVAAAVETMGETGLLQEAVLSQNLAGAQMAFDTLSGNFFGSLSNQLVASAGRLQSLLQPSGNVAETGIAAWSALMPATRSASSADYRSGFSLAGNGFSLSMAAGWLPQERMARSSAGMASMETHYSGTMLGYADGGLRVSAGAGFSWHRVVADRSVSFPGFADGNQARYRGATRQLFAEVARTASLGPVALTPFAGYSDIRVAGMDIREAGGGTGLIIDGQARRLGLAQVGLRSKASLPVAGGMRLSARFDMAWQRAWGDLASVQNSRFASNGAGFVYRGQELGRGGLDIDAGLTLERGRLAFTAGYRRNSLLQRFDDGAEFGMRLQF